MQQQLSTAKYLEPEMVEKVVPKSRRKWTTPLTWICILFMVISLTGALSAAYGFYKLSSDPPKLEKMRGPEAKRMREISKVRQEARDKYLPLLVYQEVVKLGLSVAFFFGVSMLISRNPKAQLRDRIVRHGPVLSSVCHRHLNPDGQGIRGRDEFVF